MVPRYAGCLNYGIITYSSIILQEFSEPSQTKVFMKRSASATPDEGVRQGIQVSITANFQALQQKLRRELLLRGVRVR